MAKEIENRFDGGAPHFQPLSRQIGLEKTMISLDEATGFPGRCGSDQHKVVFLEPATNPPGLEVAIIANVLALLLQGIAVGRQAYGTLLGVTIGVPGLVDRETGTLLYSLPPT